jgi:hypothetical protein
MLMTRGRIFVQSPSAATIMHSRTGTTQSSHRSLLPTFRIRCFDQFLSKAEYPYVKNPVDIDPCPPHKKDKPLVDQRGPGLDSILNTFPVRLFPEYGPNIALHKLSHGAIRPPTLQLCVKILPSSLIQGVGVTKKNLSNYCRHTAAPILSGG